MARYSPMELAQAFMRTGEFDDALEALNQQLESEPNHPEALRWRSQILARKQRYADALGDLNAITPKSDDDWVAYSIMQERMAQPEQAYDAMREAYALNPSERHSERMVQLLLAMHRPQEALDCIRQQPRTWRWLQYEGDTWVVLGQYATALQAYTEVLSQLETLITTLVERQLFLAIKARVMLARAQCAVVLGDYDLAQADFERAKRYVNDDSINFSLGVVQVLKGQEEAGLAVCQQAFQQAKPLIQEAMLHSLRTLPLSNGTIKILKHLGYDNK